MPSHVSHHIWVTDLCEKEILISAWQEFYRKWLEPLCLLSLGVNGIRPSLYLSQNLYARRAFLPSAKCWKQNKMINVFTRIIKLFICLYFQWELSSNQDFLYARTRKNAHICGWTNKQLLKFIHWSVQPTKLSSDGSFCTSSHI